MKPNEQEVEQPVRSVKFISAEYQNHQQNRKFGGEVKSATTSPLSFKVGGTIEVIHVKKGQRVKQGDLIAELDKEEFKLALDKANAALGSANAAHFQAKDQFERANKLKERGFVSDSELLTIKADLDAKAQQVNVALTDVDNAALSLARTSLYAPFSGQISAVFLDEFTKISSGTSVTELINSNAYQVDFLVPESLIQEVKFGEQLSVSIPALNDLPLTGIVSEIGAVVEKGNAYSVSLMLENTGDLLRNGMGANVNFTIGKTHEEVVLLPLTAFNFSDSKARNEKENAAIFVVSEELVLEKRYVQVRRNINSEVVVLSNLKEGEKVVVAGIPYLFEGQKVTLWNGV
ncbi:efflux RND transporter periplasmic adaptor subunit [Vibrio aquaticus]|uniref:Efflux RND transporter periplasmic adaptor subunit n=1 Tax=Vibrio aquaticus TaxID=2496559 RepID=A0A3S0QF09_9VIBR|nr:efflux RND transporter periplasmic adaptor subunit [Vibrio aquaticus]RTZ17403.1 efflux RND transporter periplasmic adaptor subunit [Vibrio aquaticus]